MCKNYNELSFTHFVVAGEDGTIFGSARQDGRVYNFLIREEVIHAQSGEQWYELEPHLAELVRSRVQLAYGNTPVYRTERLLIN